MSNDNNSGFAAAFGGVIMIGMGIALMNIPDSPVLLALALMVGGVILAATGLADR